MAIGGMRPVSNRRANRGWRAAVFAEAESVRADLVLASRERQFKVDLGDRQSIGAGTGPEADAMLARMVLQAVADAEAYGSQRSWPWRWLSGSHNEGAWASLHSAHELLIELMSPTRLASFTPQAAEICRKSLPANDPQRIAVEQIVKAVTDTPPRRLGELDRGVLRDALHSAHARNEKRYQRARTVRNGTFGVATLLVALTFAAVVAGAVKPTSLPMCLESDAPGTTTTYVCPTDAEKPHAGDVALVAMTGMVAAAISAARALSGTTRRVGPYSSTAAQATVKLVLGALLAVVGVTLLRARWVPGVDDVDTGAEILAWALLFGYAQQVLTGLLDQRAEAALAPPEPETADQGSVVVSDDDAGTLPGVVPDEEPAEVSGTDPAAGADPGAGTDPAAGGVVDGAEAEVDEADAEPVDEADAADVEGDVPESAVVPDVPPDQAGAPPRRRARSAASAAPATPAARRRGAARGG
ncbi:MAG TPA: hypothetical protein VF519_06475 [Mycobacteriales bacterium]|jgi:hypothetical protein